MKIRVIESKASNFADTLSNKISKTCKCDVDDVQWDEDSYPKKAKMSFVVYNVSAKTAEDIRDKVEQLLSDSGYDIWPGHSVDFEKDSSYVGPGVKSAYRIYFSVKRESEDLTEGTAFKRIASTTEFDNGHVIFNDWKKMTDEEAEELAKQKSIENPGKVYYVKYDDIMNPCSDIKWKNGKALKESKFNVNSGNAHLDNSVRSDVVEESLEHRKFLSMWTELLVAMKPFRREIISCSNEDELLQVVDKYSNEYGKIIAPRIDKLHGSFDDKQEQILDHIHARKAYALTEIDKYNNEIKLSDSTFSELLKIVNNGPFDNIDINSEEQEIYFDTPIESQTELAEYFKKELGARYHGTGYGGSWTAHNLLLPNGVEIKVGMLQNRTGVMITAVLNECRKTRKFENLQLMSESLNNVLYHNSNFGSFSEATSKAGQVSKMTYKGTRIPNYSWAQFDCGAYVIITAPQNKALDLKVGSKAGRVVGKVKDTYVYSSNNSTGRMGRDNDFRNELDASAPQSCLVEVHDDYKIKQHGEATNRIIIPTEWLREVSEKDYKDAVNRIPRKGLDKIFNKNKKRVESFSDNSNATFLNQLENEVKTAVKKFMMQPHIGFPEDEVDEYSNVKVKLEGEHIEIQVGAELSYEPLEELCTALNKVIIKYDRNAYFEPECPGRIVAYLMQYPYLENMSSDLTEALDLGNDGSSDDSYTHYTFTFNGQRYSFQECNDNYKVAYHRNKDFIKGIYPYDDAEHPWAYSNHDDTKWTIVKAGNKIDSIDSDDLQPVLQLLQRYDKDVEPKIIHN